ncbi:CPBP family intramembrane glutamic endopeptidase [Halorussus halobius]|uniref:CPBP family intramembrane glutamic endopeptidase n=1 Tax=Halorussus halobius TaxID=1710537 RepID=UPI001092C670|nr:CPBP family intramembrane glutamic endopeptidase [Halorussus halobius]
MSSLKRTLRRVATGSEDTRVRATWRGILPWCVGFGVQLLLLPVILLGIRSAFDVSEFGAVTTSLVESTLLGVASALGLIFAVGLATRLDERSISAYGIAASREDLTDLVVGVAIGGLTYAVPTAVFLYLGEAELAPSGPLPADSLGVIVLAITLTVAGFLFQVAFEEFAFRGVMLKNFTEGLIDRGGSWSSSALFALLFSSVIFGFSHVIRQGGGGSEGRSLQLVITSALLGLLWGGGYVMTGNLSIPFGLHLGYNLWPAVVLQPSEATLLTPALGQVSYSVSRYELVVGKVLAGGICLVVWLYLSRGELTIGEGIGD